MKRSNSLCFLVNMAVSRTARRESTAANDLTRESRRSVNRSRTCAYLFALRSARGDVAASRLSPFLAREREVSILQAFAKHSRIVVLQILSPDDPVPGRLGSIFGGLLRRPDTHPRGRT